MSERAISLLASWGPSASSSCSCCLSTSSGISSRKKKGSNVFAGIVEEMGAVKSLEKALAGTRLSILAKTVMDDLPIGASISVNGACLTVVKRDDKEFTVDVSPETLGVTNLGALSAGSPVNLER